MKNPQIPPKLLAAGASLRIPLGSLSRGLQLSPQEPNLSSAPGASSFNESINQFIRIAADNAGELQTLKREKIGGIHRLHK